MSSDVAIIAGVRAQWEQGLLLDFTIEVEGCSFKVNKCIMSAVSDYFHAMFTAGMDESQKDSVKLETVSSLVMEHLINFIYKGHMDLTKATATDILHGAVYLQIKSAITACTDFILENLDATLCYEVLSLFQNYSLQDGISKIRAYIKDNLKSIGTECDPNVILCEECCFIVNNWQDFEVDLFHFVKKWLDADHERQGDHLMDIMSKIRFGLMTDEELLRIVEKYFSQENYYTSVVPLRDLFINAEKYHDLPMNSRILDTTEQTRVRCEPNITLFSTEYVPPLCYTLDADKQWNKRPAFSLSVDKFYELNSAVEVNNFLVLANYSDSNYTGLHIFDPRIAIEDVVMPMDSIGMFFAMIYHASYIYVLGGTDDDHIGFDTVDRYDFKTDTWTSFATLPSTRLWHAACGYNDTIYVSGGVHNVGDEPLKNVDCLNLSTMEWQSKAPLLEAEFQHKMFTMKLKGMEVVCVLGRRFQLDHYDLSSDQWCRFEFSCKYKLPTDTPGGAVIVKGNTLYFVDDHTDCTWNNGGVCFEVMFPETGQEVTVNKFKHFLPDPRTGTKRIGLCGAVLALPP